MSNAFYLGDVLVYRTHNFPKSNQISSKCIPGVGT